MADEDSLRDLGVRSTPGGGRLRVWSANADAIELCLFDEADPHWITSTVPLAPRSGGVWEGTSPLLTPGRAYGIRVAGPTGPGNTFNASSILLDPYTRGLTRVTPNTWRSVVVDDGFDWGSSRKPATPLDETVVYEAHVRGITKLSKAVPAALRGTYAGLANEATIGYLKDLGVTAIELLPVHAFASERRLIAQGRTNYWGYNSLAFFAPHAPYASAAAQRGGPAEVLREFKGMVKLLHEAGLEVLLDVVYNHTAEEGIGGPRSSFRGIDNSSYYRQAANGEYVDTTGCGNTLDFSTEAANRLVHDSVRYWAEEVQIDGFRFDLAATLGRDAMGAFETEHPLLLALRDDPRLEGVKLIAEPWDVGMGGWQTGHFPTGWSEWNDHFRNSARDFWLSDTRSARAGTLAPGGPGKLAGALAGSADVFAKDRGPLAAVNFVTAHDGFTLADLTAYDTKHNLGNGEQNRDGSDDNRSYNFGVEGETRDETVLAARRRAMRNLLGTLLVSAGVPMITAGDEFGRTQRGNNNAYNQDSELTWVSWQRAPWQQDLTSAVRRLLRIRRENPALRPSRFAVQQAVTPAASLLTWYTLAGEPMTSRDWHDASTRSFQYVADSTLESAAPGTPESNSVLVLVAGAEGGLDVRLPKHAGVTGFELVWTSATEDGSPVEEGVLVAPGSSIPVEAPVLCVFRAVTDPGRTS